MTSTYSPALRLELMATGDQSGTWGDTTNTNLGTLLEQAITGFLSVAEGDTTLTLTALDGATDQARNAVINLTGAMTGAQNVVVPTSEKVYLIKNSTSGGFAVTVKTAAGTGVTVPPGTARWLYCDGTNVVDGMSGPWSPSANDAQALGFSGTAWADLFLASGGVINWNAGDVTITHSANTLAFAGASSGYTFDAVISGTTASFTGLTLTSTDAGAGVAPILELYRNSATPAANDILGQLLFTGEDSAGNTQEYGSIEALVVAATSTAETGALDFYTPIAGARTKTMSVGPNNPNTTTQFINGYATTATAAGTTTLTVLSAGQQFFTGTTTQTVVLPVTSTLVLGQSFEVHNNSTGAVTVNSSGANLVQTMAQNSRAVFKVILTSGTSAASWEVTYYPAAAGIALLVSGTVSAAATLPLVLTGYTGYRGLLIKLTNIVPATDGANLLMRVSTDGGSSYDAGASDYQYSGILGIYSGGTGNANSVGASAIAMAANVGNGAAEGCSFEVRLDGQTSTASYPKIIYDGIVYVANDDGLSIYGTARRQAAQDTDAVQFLFSSGNIASCTYAVYGYL